MSGTAGLLPQAFETDILGFPVWRLSDPKGAVQAVSQVERQGGGLIACRIAEEDAPGEAALRDAGFLKVETLVTLARPLSRAEAGPSPAGVDLARAEDAFACGAVAAQAFSKDRYHADLRIDRAGADEIKRRWAENAVRGRADRVFVTRFADGRVSGFNACMALPDRAAIDLIGVLPEATGRGWGAAMVQAAIAHYAASRSRMEVGTQVANDGSLRFYRRLGFVDLRRQTSWHWMG